MVSTTVSIPGYQVSEQLYNGSRTLVYRGDRETDRKPVVIKLLKNPYPSFSELLSFRNQYTIAKNLNSPLIIQTYSLEPYQNGYALVMEDFGGISLKDYFTSPETRNITSLKEFLEIAIALCNTLDILYRSRIIHKDIKPANILINPETKQVKLIDFSIASLLPRETQTLMSPNVLEGTLAYISPEQTGRMNRGIDYRTDFYSLGVTFYELLTGELPFQSHDPMELIHCHIAKLPPLVGNSKDIPQVLGNIAMKLIAKNAEDRYQSALGIKFDLENCLTQLQKTGKIESFEIARRDLCDRFTIPEKLYGRKTEVQTLLDAFERVSLGDTELMLVAGFSGIGKTAVVNEVHKPIVRQRGYFIKGKYDQFGRNIPLSAFVQAFRDLMGQFLSESNAKLQVWKTKILEAVGDSGQILIDVIPELERIVGAQPPATELSGSAAQNRFNLLMQKFVQVFTSVEHPLVIFLDDLQWADSASPKLLQLLMEKTRHLLVLGAYRDNEVSPAHPFILTVEEIVKTGARVNTINLQSLSVVDLNQLVSDTLNCELSLAQPLTELVYQKTQGNPFFITQFLKVLHEDKYITFDWEARHWHCDIAEVRALAITDDVVEFMALQLQKLLTETQNMLKLAACIGAQFDLNTLAIVSEKSLEDAAIALWKALQEGLIIPTTEIYKFFTQSDTVSVYHPAANPTYRFLHDRVQQAAYSLIPDEQKQATHWAIGQLLLRHTPVEEQDAKIFDIVNQLNAAIDGLTQHQDRDELASLNFKAGCKAKASAAYEPALRYGAIGLSLLSPQSWQSQYQLILSLHELAAEAACLIGEFEQTEELTDRILQQATTILDKVKAYEIKIQAKMVNNQQLAAVEIGLQVLKELAVIIPKSPTGEDIQQVMGATAAQLASINIEDLIHLPLMTDASKLAAMRMLSSMAAPAFLAAPALFPLIVASQVNLSLQFGNSPDSAVGYGTYGLILNGVFQDIESGYRFGDLALQLVDKLNGNEQKSKIYYIVGFCTKYGKKHVRETLPILQEAYLKGLENGDLEFAGYSGFKQFQHPLYLGDDLATLLPKIAVVCDRMAQLNQAAALDYLTILQQAIANLLGEAKDPCRLVGDAYNEDTAPLEQMAVNNRTGTYFFYIYKLILCYLFGSYTEALDNANEAEKYENSVTGMLDVPVFCFYDTLTQLALYDDGDRSQKILEKVQANQAKMENWAYHAPMNFQHKYDLVEAERWRVLDSKLAAIEYYDRAIFGAKANGYVNEEALANELAAKFYLNWGKEKVAQAYMQEAYYCYARWGAKAKVDDLEKCYSHLLQPILQQQRINFNPLETIGFTGTSSSPRTSISDSTSISNALDFTSILKAAQAISSSLELHTLITSLTQIILENSGAEKCILLLPQEDTWQVQAITFIDSEKIQTILKSQSLDNCQDIPVKIINYVKNTQQTVVIDNCKTDIPGVIGKYMLSQQPQSVLCVPIINQGLMVAILYLENKLTQGVFTSDRLSVIHLLSSQAAISLENARLYQEAGQALHDLQQAQLQVVQSEKMSALGNLVAGVAHEMNNPLGFIYASLKQAKPTVIDIVEHLKLYQESLPNPSDEIKNHAEDIDLDYSLSDLPKIIDSMTMACDRLRNISTSLRTFSRADKDYKVPFNIHEGIDSTILILKHRLKANEERPAIEVINDYGNLPQVECFPGQLNQVFMNILANAIDALDESNTGRSFEEIKQNPNRIIIKTLVENEGVKIAIADNGKGMNESVKQKIFDHLFTTKGVGKGTGLGLAIAHQIVEEKHDGVIEVDSKLGEGTEFVIQLPL
ncbi:ATP-binding sensor histidine kinase [Nostoc sp. NMS4]|uniref:ATP-binding sensor histidine kinase n=1 Tax=Nostoc sp. NMS4 TaxID=2815390 RepID=UPI0025EF2C68|nr:ATP-binding sensor histidine kinase [Nostoc sp. NMS4]MBN3923463.1 AAA family ATPase [Nostoc sp. NMS4]